MLQFYLLVITESYLLFILQLLVELINFLKKLTSISLIKLKLTVKFQIIFLLIEAWETSAVWSQLGRNSCFSFERSFDGGLVIIFLVVENMIVHLLASYEKF